MMNFRECYAEIGNLLRSSGIGGHWCIEVKAWGNGDVQWTAWISARSKHLYAENPDRLAEMVLDYLQSEHTAPMTLAEVVAP